MGILVCVPDAKARRLIGAVPDGIELIEWDGEPDQPDSLAGVRVLVGGPGFRLDPQAALRHLPALEVVLVVSAGLGAWAAPVADGTVPASVSVHNGRGIHTAATAELAVAGLLATVRELPTFAEQQRAHQWRRHFVRGLQGRRVLVVGAGEIGGRVADAVRLFEASVTLVARTSRDGVYGPADLPQLLGDHDVVVIAVPHTGATDRLVDAAFLKAMPDGAILVNIARGQVVVTSDLLAELATGRLRAVLDVTDPEPLPADHPLWDAPGLILTPHVGGLTAEWEQRAFGLVREQLTRLASGQPLLNWVDPASC